MSTPNGPTRRALLRGAALAGIGASLPGSARAQSVPKYGNTAYPYEVTRTEAEWRDLLSEKEYEMLREGGTEFPTSDPKWNDYSAGEFACGGCNLPLYSSEWRAPIELGWLFFYHSHPDAVLTGIDRGNPYGGGNEARMGSPDNPERTLIETHCRRCGSHLGHIVHIDGELVHCINGASLSFTAMS